MGTLAVVELPGKTGLAKDKYVNTFAFAEAAPSVDTPANAAIILTAVERMYNVAHADLNAVSLGAKIGPQVNRAAGACAIKLYDITDHLDGSPHGSPFAISTFTLPASDGVQGLPEEVAYCVTLEAQNRGAQRVEVADGVDPDAKPDRPRQRFTGRIYLGPLSAGQADRDAQSMTRPYSYLMAGSRSVVVRMAQEVDTNSGDTVSLGVWSRKDRAIRGIDNVRSDDAFDTQRRRGVAPAAITRVAIPGIGVPELELGA